MKNLHEEIEAHVQAVMRKIEKTHGEDVAEIIDGLLDEFISSAVEQAIAHNIHPGKIINAFIEVIIEVENSSNAMMITRGKHTILGNN